MRARPSAVLILVALGAAGCLSRTPVQREVRAPTAPLAEPEPYAPPASPLECEGGLSQEEVAIDWQVLKTDDHVGPAQVTVLLDRARRCRVQVGDLPRHCAFNEERDELTCSDADGDRPHRVRVEHAGDAVAVWIETPEGPHALANVPVRGSP